MLFKIFSLLYTATEKDADFLIKVKNEVYKKDKINGPLEAEYLPPYNYWLRSINQE